MQACSEVVEIWIEIHARVIALYESSFPREKGRTHEETPQFDDGLDRRDRCAHDANNQAQNLQPGHPLLQKDRPKNCREYR